jgi:hypothetical protein
MHIVGFYSRSWAVLLIICSHSASLISINGYLRALCINESNSTSTYDNDEECFFFIRACSEADSGERNVAQCVSPPTMIFSRAKRRRFISKQQNLLNKSCSKFIGQFAKCRFLGLIRKDAAGKETQ